MDEKDTIWMKDARLSNIPHEKLDFILQFFFQSKSLAKKDMLPFLISLTKVSKEKNIQFNEEELNAIVEVLKENSSAKEAEIIQKMLLARQKKFEKKK